MNNKIRTAWTIAAIALVLGIPTALADWWLDVHIDSALWPLSDDEYNSIFAKMDGKHYNGPEYSVWKCTDWHKSDTTSTSMGWCKIFHYFGHGDYISWSNNWLENHWSEKIRAWEIPYLGNVWEGGGPTLLVFYNACESGRVNWLYPNRWLIPASLTQGAKAGIGHDNVITAGRARRLTDKFYELAGQGQTIGYAFDQAKQSAADPTAVFMGNRNMVIVN